MSLHFFVRVVFGSAVVSSLQLFGLGQEMSLHFFVRVVFGLAVVSSLHSPSYTVLYPGLQLTWHLLGNVWKDLPSAVAQTGSYISGQLHSLSSPVVASVGLVRSGTVVVKNGFVLAVFGAVV